MSTSLIWAIAAATCLVAELLTGTFYLLVLCLAFSVGSALAALELSFTIQVVSAAVTGLLGTALVHRWRAKNKATEPALPLTQGTATVVAIQAQGYRVRWRGSEWDAEGPAGLSENATVAIVGQTGNRLRIEAR